MLIIAVYITNWVAMITLLYCWLSLFELLLLAMCSIIMLSMLSRL